MVVYVYTFVVLDDEIFDCVRKTLRLSHWLASKTSVSCSVVFGSVFGYFRQATGRWGESNLLMVCLGLLD